MSRDQILELVFEQLKEDVSNSDFTAIESLLSVIPDDYLLAYLPEGDSNA